MLPDHGDMAGWRYNRVGCEVHLCTWSRNLRMRAIDSVAAIETGKPTECLEPVKRLFNRNRFTALILCTQVGEISTWSTQERQRPLYAVLHVFYEAIGEGEPEWTACTTVCVFCVYPSLISFFRYSILGCCCSQYWCGNFNQPIWCFPRACFLRW